MLFPKRLILIVLLSFYSGIKGNTPPAKHLYPIVWKWMKGKSDSVYYFNFNTHPGIINNLQDAYQVRRAREYWYNKNLDSFHLGRHNWLGVTNFAGRFQTLKGVWRSGFDMVEQTLGGFTVHIQPINSDTIEFTVLDIKSRWSLFLHLPFIKNKPYSSVDSEKRKMMNTHWIITWREPVTTYLFYQRLYNMRFLRRSFTGHNF